MNAINPAHYQKGGVQCIEAIEASMSKEAFKGFLKGNCIKYIYRYENKNGAEDLRKAEWYLLRLIALREDEETMAKEIMAITEEVLAVDYDPDDYQLPSGCPDGFCPLPGVRQGPPEGIVINGSSHR
jgi:Protein of unknwon function (DUF3310).